MQKRRRSDLPDRRELEVPPSVWLRWYEQHLCQVLAVLARGKDVDQRDLELVLFDRSDLERTIRAKPNALTPAEKHKLKRLDSELRKLAPAIKAAIPDLEEMRQSLNVPKSHWWWFLDEEDIETRG
ncbi:MAG: hypothetical protein N3B10_02175 [Armatimonadetes bacterium]|nr:hypothetical protein [Armatimonadota bacterium]MCX7967277.1 hypothetical protein [Armatimonadota bacterium]MDW8141915.1 hypothetical protein [Armatimonadota bacterium]